MKYLLDQWSIHSKQLRTSCNLSTMSKREQEWSYPLPSLTFTESDASPLLDIEDVVDSSSTTSTTTTTATNTQRSV